MLSRQWIIFFFLFTLISLLFINLAPRYYTARNTYASIKELNHKPNIIAKEDLFPNQPSIFKYFQTKDDFCETIHVGIVCAGYSTNLYFHTLLKSILFYRVNPIHFHVITNKVSEKILKTLMESWLVPQVNVTFYDLNKLQFEARWVPNTHYSGINGLMKLIFPNIIPLNVTQKLLVLDTDLTLMNDIYKLWKLFDKFNRKQAIGIVENQSEFYLKENSWPAIGKGFNTGVMLFDLKALNSLNWSKLWQNVTRRTASIYGTTRLGDQDVVNAVLKENPEIYYQVPCFWNTQLSDHTQSRTCYKKHRISIVHWNSPKKYKVINRDGEYFRSIANRFLELNGYLLKNQLRYCDLKPDTSDDPSEEEFGITNVCSEFNSLNKTPWRTLLFFKEYKYEYVERDITFVAQLSYDRLQTIEELAKYWKGPISLSLYVSDAELMQSINFISDSDVLKGRENIAYHAVFKRKDSYPINKLRNVGLANIDTTFVFLADIDFLPSKGLYDALRDNLKTMDSMNKKALIVPAFQIQKYGSPIPRDKNQLFKSLEDKSVVPFLSTVWSQGHGPTNYDKWKKAGQPYTVKWEPDFEPYIVVRSDVVQYDERFVGFGWNKVSHIMELEAQNYEFIVLPDVFIIHKPHVPSYDLGRYRSSSDYRRCLQILKEEFIQKLNKAYNRLFEYSNSSIAYDSLVNRRRKRNPPPVEATTFDTSTDYPFFNS